MSDKDSDDLRARIAKLELSTLPDAAPFIPGGKDVASNPEVRKLSVEHPRIFAGFDRNTWLQLYADTRDNGRPLTREEIVEGIEEWRRHLPGNTPKNQTERPASVLAKEIAALEETDLPDPVPYRFEQVAFVEEPAIEELVRTHPRLFAGFTLHDWEWIYTECMSSEEWAKKSLIVDLVKIRRPFLIEVNELENTDLPDHEAWTGIGSPTPHTNKILSILRSRPRLFAGFSSTDFKSLNVFCDATGDSSIGAIIDRVKDWRNRSLHKTQGGRTEPPHIDYEPDLGTRHIEPEYYALDEEPQDLMGWFLGETRNYSSEAPRLTLNLSAVQRDRNKEMAEVIENFPAIFGDINPADIIALFSPNLGKEDEPDAMLFSECLQWIREKRRGNDLVAEAIRRKVWRLRFVEGLPFEPYSPTAEEAKRNPVVGMLVKSLPELFGGFVEADWKELYSLQTTEDMDGIFLVRDSIKKILNRKKDHRRGSRDVAEMFSANIAKALSLYDGLQKDVYMAAGIDKTMISRWKSQDEDQTRAIKLTLPIANFARVLGIEPDSLWEPELRRVGPVLVDVILGRSPPIIPNQNRDSLPSLLSASLERKISYLMSTRDAAPLTAIIDSLYEKHRPVDD